MNDRGPQIPSAKTVALAAAFIALVGVAAVLTMGFFGYWIPAIMLAFAVAYWAVENGRSRRGAVKKEPEISDYDFQNMPAEVAKIALDLGEKRLQSTIEFGLASDQRALVQAGIFGAVAAGAVAVIATLPPDTPSRAAISVGIATFSGFNFVACALSLWNARPIDFGAAGYHPAAFSKLQSDDRLIQYVAESVAKRIDENIRRLNAASSLTFVALALAFTSLPVAVISGLAVSSLSSPADPARAD